MFTDPYHVPDGQRSNTFPYLPRAHGRTAKQADLHARAALIGGEEQGRQTGLCFLLPTITGAGAAWRRHALRRLLFLASLVP